VTPAPPIYQFRVFLEDVRPLVWRRIQVPADFAIARLHRVIQAIMDWQDCHLHEFSVADRTYGAPDPEEEREVLDERGVRLQDIGLSVGDRVAYIYDFGDNWRLVLQLEHELLPDADTVYPVCVDGESSAPPEDVGGTSGYEEFLEALADPDHEDHLRMKEWVGQPFDQSAFSLAETNRRLQKMVQPRKRR